MATLTAYAVVYLADDPSANWPLDVGDDPSFESSSQHRGQLSWGVCRTDLRNQVRPGDLIIFFAGEKLPNGAELKYRFVGWATVTEKVSQVDVWEQPRLAIYRAYRNLLIRPGLEPGSYEHYESNHPWHGDWLWRLGNSPVEPKKPAWVVAGRGGHMRNRLIEVDGWRLRPAKNYVLFDSHPEATRVLADPPSVAQAGTGAGVESWFSGSLPASLQSLLLYGITHRGLRTTNRPQPHRHIRLAMPVLRLQAELEDLCRRHGLIGG